MIRIGVLKQSCGDNKAAPSYRSRAALSSVAPVLWWLGGGAARLAGLPQGCPVRQPLRVTALWLASKAVVVANAQPTEAAIADITNTRATALSFQSTTFDIVDQHGQQWLKASDIARALGYAREDAVSRIYERNAVEFRLDMSLTVKLTVNGINDSKREKEVRIFSLRGAHLIAMFARTPVAKEFRAWVLDVLESQSGNTSQDTNRIDLARQLAHAATAQVYQAVFDAVLKDGEPPHFTRLLLGFTGSSQELRPHVQALESGSIAMTLPQLAKAIRTDLMVPDTTLANLAAACTHRMAERAECQALRAAASTGQIHDHQGSLQLR